MATSFCTSVQIQEQNKEIVREVINAIDNGDLDKLGNLLSDDALAWGGIFPTHYFSP